MISVEDVRRLMAAEDPDATLTLVGGKAVISGQGDAGGLPVVTRADLLARAGGRLDSDQGLEEVAAELDVLASELGG
jgi:CTP:molybdopterin cytidylyltransferase MocA